MVFKVMAPSGLGLIEADCDREVDGFHAMVNTESSKLYLLQYLLWSRHRKDLWILQTACVGEVPSSSSLSR